jgi:uncharacterized RDD family membrane protein YckC
MIMVYSGFWKRFIAMLLDLLVLIVPGIILNYLVPYAGSLIASIFYYPVFMSSPLQTTPGKYWMGIRVIHENGSTLSFGRALSREVLKIFSGLFFLLGYLIQPFTAKRQALHDLIVNSVVVDHSFAGSPDWFQIWLRQMKVILKAESPLTAAAPIEAEVVEVKKETSSDTVQGSSDAVSAIEKLYSLYKEGALTEEEYQNKKSELLKQV